MQNDNLPTLQQKIQSSRKIWTSYQNDKFIDRLYKILDVIIFYLQVRIDKFIIHIEPIILCDNQLVS